MEISIGNSLTVTSIIPFSRPFQVFPKTRASARDDPYCDSYLGLAHHERLLAGPPLVVSIQTGVGAKFYPVGHSAMQLVRAYCSWFWWKSTSTNPTNTIPIHCADMHAHLTANHRQPTYSRCRRTMRGNGKPARRVHMPRPSAHHLETEIPRFAIGVKDWVRIAYSLKRLEKEVQRHVRELNPFSFHLGTYRRRPYWISRFLKTFRSVQLDLRVDIG